MNPHKRKLKKRKNIKRPNWGELWQFLRKAYVDTGEDRQVAVLDNYSKDKEAICRKLGVVNGADVTRIYSKIKSSI